MESLRTDSRLRPGWWTLFLVIFLAAVVFVTSALFSGTFTSYVPITLTSDRSGLVMEPGGKVKMQGVEVGRVGDVESGDPVSLKLEIFPDQLQYLPANIGAQIRATTAFGAKFVDLTYPVDPSPQHLQAGAVIEASNVSTEVNTVFQNLMGVLKQIDPAKLNGVLSALAEGLRGQGPAIGQATTDANEVLLALNPRAETFRRDWHSFKGFSDTYSAAAQNILTVLDAAATTSATITTHAKALDALLLNITGLSRSGENVLGASKDNLVTSINDLESTTSLLLKYNPEITCTIVGGKYFLDHGGYKGAGGNGKSSITDVGLLLGDDPYSYPDNLPVVGAKGGPGGKPGCGSLPYVEKMYPVRQLVTNTGWGTGNDIRTNPGIGFPAYNNFFPVTRGNPRPPSIRNLFGGPAPGPIPYLGAPPYGAPMYAPDGTPLWPGLPPGVPSASPPPDPNDVPAGAEPFTPPVTADLVPTPLPPPPP
jgi:phospholipid/cholesterol/gamma-HCH transport system substrate-binding protein